jgi:hypothetical protein
LQSLCDGDLFEWGISSCEVLVWVSPTEVIVGYGIGEGFPEVERFAVFSNLVHHLRHSAPLDLGKVGERSSYGAVYADRRASFPEVKWAQFGDWAGLARGWYLGRRTTDLEAALHSD